MNQAQQFFAKESARMWEAIDSHPDQLHEPIREDQWTAWMIIAHIVTATRGMIEFALNQLRHTESSSSPVDPNFNLDRWNDEQIAAWNGRTVEELRTQWEKTTARFQDFVEQVEAAPDSDQILYHPVGMEFKLHDYLKMITIHMRMHRVEITDGFAKLDTQSKVVSDAAD